MCSEETNRVELGRAIIQLHGLRAQLKEIKDKETEVANRVKMLFGGAGSMVATAVLSTPTQSSYQVLAECVEQPPRKTYNTKAMLADGYDLTPYEKIGKPFLQLKLKELD